jgi:hypothetical protein
MQVGRQKLHDKHGMINIDSKISEVEEKRAATCHTRKRKVINQKEKIEKLIKMKDNNPLYEQ